MTAFSQISSVWCVCRSGLRLCAPNAPRATTRKPLTAARRRHQAEVMLGLLIPSIVVIRHRAGGSSAHVHTSQRGLLSLCTFHRYCGSLVSGILLKLSALAADNTNVL